MASFGTKLKQEREKRGVTLDEISRSTKIGTRLLRALEEEHFDQLPGGIFNKGFIRAYARFLGMDEEEVIGEYLAATTSSPPGKEPADNGEARPAELRIIEEPDDRSAGLPWGAFAVVLLVMALGFALWGFYSRESHKAERPPAPAVSGSNSVSPTAVADRTPSQHELTIETSKGAPAGPKPGAQMAQTNTGSGPSVTAPANISVPASVQAQSLAPTGRFRVLIKARQDSWISISVDGEVTMQDTLIAPAQKSVTAEREIVIKAGNVGALDFEFRGKTLPSQGNYGEVKTLTFGPNGLQPPPPTTQVPAPEP